MSYLNENLNLGDRFSLGRSLAVGGLICVVGCFRWPFANCQQVLDLLKIYIFRGLNRLSWLR